MKHLVVIGIVGLFIASCGSDKKDSDKTSVNETVSTMKSGELKIGFFNGDSIPNHFELYKTENGKIEAEGLGLQQKGASMQTNYQNLANEFQRGINSNTLTDNQIKSYQERLGKLQQGMEMFQQNEMIAFQEKQYKMGEILQNKIAKYSEEFAKEKGLTMFFARGSGSGVAYADPGLDLTESFIAYMNEQEKALNGEEK